MESGMRGVEESCNFSQTPQVVCVGGRVCGVWGKRVWGVCGGRW